MQAMSAQTVGVGSVALDEGVKEVATVPAAVQLDRVSRRYRTGRSTVVEAVREVDLTINDGEFVSLVGPSGCGKSTLLRIVAGLDRPSSGTVFVDGRVSTGPSRHIGIVYQTPSLLAWRTAVDNVLLPLEIQGQSSWRAGRKSRAAARSQARDLLDLVGLHGFEQAYPHQLSGGMQQRVSLARALIVQPRLLLMDEPFGALDAITREQMNMELLRVWEQTKNTVLFVTHSVDEAVILSDRVVVMRKNPGAIVDETLITLPRPRTLDMLTNDTGVQDRATLRAQLDQHSTPTPDTPTTENPTP